MLLSQSILSSLLFVSARRARMPRDPMRESKWISWIKWIDWTRTSLHPQVREDLLGALASQQKGHLLELDHFRAEQVGARRH